VIRAVVAVVVAAVAVLGPAGAASATWSIVAVDPETGQVGVAMASCVEAGILGEPDRALVPVVLVPGLAAAVTQATIEPTAPVELRRLLSDGATGPEAVALLLEEDERPTIRQLAVVLLDGAPEVFTGEEVEAVSASVVVDGASAQGVLLTGTAVVDRAMAAFEASRGEGRSLARSLVDALVAGSAEGGDRRCGPDQTALFAHVAVAEPDDDPQRPSLLATVTVDEGDGQNPVALLDRALDEGQLGWTDAGLDDPVGVPRLAVMAVGAALAVAAALVLRRGLGSPAARR
jgi:uncharacterized Ntn-hydrolase superfamily protein